MELHVYNPQHKLLDFLKSKGITPQAYSPLGSSNSPLLADPDVVSIAEQHKLQPVDVLLGYLRKIFRVISIAVSHSLITSTVAKGIVVLPKSVTPARITANLSGAVRAFETLTKVDVERLDALAAAGKQKRFVHPRSTVFPSPQLLPLLRLSRCL